MRTALVLPGRVITLILVVVLAGAGVLAAAAAAHGPRVIGIGQKQNDDKAGVHVGDTLVVALPASPKSGFAWKVVGVNRRLLKPDRIGFIPARHPPLAQAARGVAILIFRVVAAGTSTLRINYVRGATVAKGYSVRVLSEPPD